MHKTEGANNVANLFTDGPPGTTVEQNFLNAMQEEICYVITQSGLVLKTASTETRQQLFEAIGRLGIKGDGVAGRVLRVSRLFIKDGTNATTIKLQLDGSPVYFNGDNLTTPVDNIAKDSSSTYYNFGAGGNHITINAAGLSGDCVGVIATIISKNSSTVHLNVYGYADGGNMELWFFHGTTGAIQDLTTLVDTGEISMMLSYMTSE